MTEKTFTGPIQNQLRNALLYIENNVLEDKITKIDGEAITLRSYNYPIDAIKELLANAVYNRSYKCTAGKAHAPWPWDERR